jgi:hypothetical protein
MQPSLFPTFTIAPPSRLRQRIGPREGPVNLGKIDVHASFYQLRRHNLARLSFLQVVFSLRQHLGTMSGTHSRRKVQTLFAHQLRQSLGIIAAVDYRQHLGVRAQICCD